MHWVRRAGQVLWQVAEHYKLTGKMKEAGIDFKSLLPTRQAAILQAFQFAPNGDWISAWVGATTRRQ